MGRGQFALLLLLATGQANAASDVPPAVETRPVFAAPTLRWDSAMLISRFATQTTALDFTNLTGGLRFGMSPAELNAKMVMPTPVLGWNTLTLANEYLEEVRYFVLPLRAAGALQMGLTACTGGPEAVVLLFRTGGLFRVSYRLVADKTCADPTEAARKVLARYVTLPQTVALSVRYRTGRTEVVDITDPASGPLAQVRWRQGRL